MSSMGSGIATGAAGGAMAGTAVFPGIGTAIGAGVGALAGGLSANAQASAAANLSQLSKKAQAQNQRNLDYQKYISDQARQDQLGALNNNYTQLFNMQAMRGTAPQMQLENQALLAQQGRINQNAVSRGLYNSTTVDNQLRGALNDSTTRRQSITQGDLAQQMALRQDYNNQQQNIIGTSADRQLGNINNASIAGPNLSNYAQYAAQQPNYGALFGGLASMTSGMAGGGGGAPPSYYSSPSSGAQSIWSVR